MTRRPHPSDYGLKFGATSTAGAPVDYDAIAAQIYAEARSGVVTRGRPDDTGQVTRPNWPERPARRGR